VQVARRPFFFLLSTHAETGWYLRVVCLSDFKLTSRVSGTLGSALDEVPTTSVIVTFFCDWQVVSQRSKALGGFLFLKISTNAKIKGSLFLVSHQQNVPF
jgi:hypothetical protein